MMRTIDITRLAATAMAAMCLCPPCNAARADRHIDCPSSAAPLASAAPILGRLDEPWGELHEVDSRRQKDGSYAIRHDLTGGAAVQLEKWLVCHYRDGSYKAIQLPAPTRECRVRNKVAGAPDTATKRVPYLVVGIVCD